MKKLTAKTKYRHARDLGVDADYCVIYAKAETWKGWKAVATCHPAAIPLIKADGIKAHASLIKLASPYAGPTG